MRKLIITSLMLALASPCIGQSREHESANVQSRDIVREQYEVCQSSRSSQLDRWDNYSVMASFRILPEGSISKESIHITHSTGVKMFDQKAIEILWQLGESHGLGPMSSLSSNTMSLLVNDTEAKFSMTGFASTEEAARAKVSQLNFLLKTLALVQRDKTPMLSESLRHLVVKADNKRVDVEITLWRGKTLTRPEPKLVFSQNHG